MFWAASKEKQGREDVLSDKRIEILYLIDLVFMLLKFFTENKLDEQYIMMAHVQDLVQQSNRCLNKNKLSFYQKMNSNSFYKAHLKTKLDELSIENKKKVIAYIA